MILVYKSVFTDSSLFQYSCQQYNFTKTHINNENLIMVNNILQNMQARYLAEVCFNGQWKLFTVCNQNHPQGLISS